MRALSEVWGDRLIVVACTIGGDADAAYDRGGGCERCGERAGTGPYGLWWVEYGGGGPEGPALV